MPFARLGRAHGLRGELRLIAFNPDSELLGKLEHVVLERGAERRPARVLALRGTDQGLIIRLEGIDDRDEAQRWTHAQVLVSADRFRPIDEDDTWYVYELEGLTAIDADGEPVGTVVTVENYGASDVLVVRTRRGADQLVPFAEPWVGDVDRQARTIRVDLNWLED